MKLNPKDTITKAASKIQEGAGALGDRATEAAAKAREAAAETAKRAGKTAADITEQAAEMAEASKQKLMTAIYNPVFPEQYADYGNNRPKMIVIENEDERKDIEVCAGAIGWLGKSAGTEVLHLYEEAVPFSGIEFNPPAECGAVYYENKLVPDRFISMDCYFDVIQRDKLTELRKIAYELGAKKCVLECYEEAKVARVAHAGVGGKEKGPALLKHEPMLIREESEKSESADEEPKSVKILASKGESANLTGRYHSAVEKRVVFSQTFEGNANPKRPELKWFANDEEIKFLIETRCNGEDANKTKNYCVQLDSSSSQTMNVVLAAKLDKALAKLCSMYNFSLEGEAKAEARRKLIFEVEF